MDSISIILTIGILIVITIIGISVVKEKWDVLIYLPLCLGAILLIVLMLLVARLLRLIYWKH